MFPGRSYRLTGASMKELEQSGLAADMLRALKTLQDRDPASRQDFMQLLDERTPDASPAERKLILKQSRLSLMRLEKLIPNRSAREWVEAIIFALVVAVIVRSFFFAPFKIPSGSMVPTIAVGDHIFATMYNYGIPIPFTNIKLFPQEIERGNIVIFPFPLDPSVDYIKRVIGVGGDTVTVNGKTVYINGEPLEEPYAYYDPARSYGGNAGSSPCDLGVGRPAKVPPGKLFMMGDNRLNSQDSRCWGFVEAATVKGRGQIVYWSHDPGASLLSGYQLGRIGTILR